MSHVVNLTTSEQKPSLAGETVTIEFCCLELKVEGGLILSIDLMKQLVCIKL